MDTAPTASSPASPARISARSERVRDVVAREGWGALLVLQPSDIAWLTGLHSSNAAVVVTDDRVVVATDFRYVTSAEALGLEVRRLEQALFSQLGELAGELAGGGPIAYGPGEISHRGFLQLTEALPEQAALRSVEGVVGQLRQVKDAGELDAIRRAAALLDDAFELVAGLPLRGMPERDVVWQVERLLRERGASAMSFDAIVAGGANGALPHHSPGSDPIPDDTLVTVDIGCIVDGYCSDATRTFAVGSPGEELVGIYDLVLRAQRAAVDAIRAGAVGRDVDAVARDIIEAAGHGEHFGHGLGHGVGIDVHEGPRLARTSSDVLEPGMVVTVEPGVYVPGVGGVRIEDLVVVTDEGCEQLVNYTKELVTADG